MSTTTASAKTTDLKNSTTAAKVDPAKAKTAA